MHIKSKGRLFGLAIIGAAFVATNASPGAGPAVASGGIAVSSSVVSNVSAMRARADFSNFLDRVLDPKRPARGEAAIKIAVSSNDGRVGTYWVTPVSRHGEIVVGLMADGASADGPWPSDGILAFSKQQVVDWSFAASDGRMYGNYAARTALSNLAPEHAARLSSVLSSDPLPENW